MTPHDLLYPTVFFVESMNFGPMADTFVMTKNFWNFFKNSNFFDFGYFGYLDIRVPGRCCQSWYWSLLSKQNHQQMVVKAEKINIVKTQTIHGKQPLMADNLWWKMTFYWRQPMMEDNFWWKTTFEGEEYLKENTFDGRRHLMDDDLQWKTTFDDL